jgi:hypothetical protein
MIQISDNNTVAGLRCAPDASEHSKHTMFLHIGRWSELRQVDIS